VLRLHSFLIFEVSYDLWAPVIEPEGLARFDGKANLCPALDDSFSRLDFASNADLVRPDFAIDVNGIAGWPVKFIKDQVSSAVWRRLLAPAQLTTTRRHDCGAEHEKQ
jgi:hypothetical protein